MDVIEAGLAAIATEKVLAANVSVAGSRLAIAGRQFNLNKVKQVKVVAVGKAAWAAAKFLEQKLGRTLSSGMALGLEPKGRLKKIQYFAGTHPWPSVANRDASFRIVGALKGLTSDDLVIFVISGGGSTLLSLSHDFSVDQEKELLADLFKKGATIQEINTVRKHISLARGGFLAKYAYPARSVALIFSDVPGNDLQFISSGPTVPDQTSVKDALAVIRKFRLKVPPTALVETPKNQKYFKRVANVLLVSNKTALSAMAERARKKGLAARIISDRLTGEARIAGRQIAERLKNLPAGTLLLYGGETTVTIKGKGKGGRNQELALSALQTVGAGEIVAAVASDGRDNSDFAGAFADEETKKSAAAKKMDIEAYLSDNNSYNFFKKVGGYILTGETGSNVADLILSFKF